jgi:hypothetical protein
LWQCGGNSSSAFSCRHNKPIAKGDNEDNDKYAKGGSIEANINEFAIGNNGIGWQGNLMVVATWQRSMVAMDYSKGDGI